MFRRLAVVKRIASSTERESKQRSRRPVLKCVSLRERRQRWLSALISNDLNRNTRRTNFASSPYRYYLKSRGRKSRPHIKVSCPHFFSHFFSAERNEFAGARTEVSGSLFDRWPDFGQAVVRRVKRQGCILGASGRWKRQANSSGENGS